MSRVVWTMRLEADNAAFGEMPNIEHPTQQELDEVAEILEVHAGMIRRGLVMRGSEGRLLRPLRDINGNTVGRIIRTVVGGD